MSGLFRLLRWAPCLWAISKLAQNGQGSRAQILSSQAPTIQQPSKPTDLLHTLSFPARTIVTVSALPRPSRATPPARNAVTEPDDAQVAQGMTFHVWRLLRQRRPLVYSGWQWERPPIWPIRKYDELYRRGSNIVSRLSRQSFARRLPREMEIAIMVSIIRAAKILGNGVSVNFRLVCQEWDQNLEKAFWKTRWLNIRPRLAYWPSIAERLQTLAKHSAAIRKVKLAAGPTDILPMSVEKALVECPELALISECRVREINVGRLDALNELLLKLLLQHRQSKIRHFCFQAEDSVLYLGRQSIFSDSRFCFPKLNRVTIDISRSIDTIIQDEPSSDDIRRTVELVVKLVGSKEGTDANKVELRLLCMPPPLPYALARVENSHISLASRLFEFIRNVLYSASGTRIAASFEAPLSFQSLENLMLIRSWARRNDIRLIDARPRQA